jgi:hypothetical protein
LTRSVCVDHKKRTVDAHCTLACERLAIELHAALAITDQPIDPYVVAKSLGLTILRLPARTGLCNGDAINLHPRLRGRRMTTACATEVARYVIGHFPARLGLQSTHAPRILGANILMPRDRFLADAQRTGADPAALYDLYPYCTLDLIGLRVGTVNATAAAPWIALARCLPDKTHASLSTAVDF